MNRRTFLSLVSITPIEAAYAQTWLDADVEDERLDQEIGRQLEELEAGTPRNFVFGCGMHDIATGLVEPLRCHLIRDGVKVRNTFDRVKLHELFGGWTYQVAAVDLANLNVSNRAELHVDDATFVELTGPVVQGALISHDGGRPLSWFSEGFPCVPTGGDLTISWHVDGLFPSTR